MGVGIGDILAALNNGVAAIRDLGTQLGDVFPQATATSTTAAVAGTLTFSSSQPEAFLSIETSSGGIYKVALYPSS